MRAEIGSRLIVAIVLAIVGYLVYLVFRPFLPGIAWAIVLTVVLRPTYLRLRARFGDRHWAAAGLVTLLVALLVIAPLTIAVVQAAGGIADGYTWLQERTQSDQPLLARFENVPVIGRLIAWLGERLDLQSLDLRSMFLNSVKSVGGLAARGAGALATNALESLLSAAVVLVALYIFLGRGPGLVEQLRDLLPLEQKDRDEAFALLESVTRAVFLGVFATAFCQGIIGGVGFAIVGIPHPVMFGGAMMLASLFPAGAALVWAPAAIWLFAQGSPGKAIFLGLWGLILVSTADNFLRPLFIGRGVRIPTILIMVGTIGGLAAWGLIGLFIGPLVITVFQFLLEVMRRDFFRKDEGSSLGTGPPSQAKT